MAYFPWLAKAVKSALSQNRIGTPVALRASFHLTPDHGRLLPILAEAVTTASGWFAGEPTRIYALGGIQTGEITVMVEFARGETALVSTAVLRIPVPLADLLLIGNRGTLRFEDAPAAGINPKLLKAIEQSLAARSPVTLAWS